MYRSLNTSSGTGGSSEAEGKRTVSSGAKQRATAVQLQSDKQLRGAQAILQNAKRSKRADGTFDLLEGGCQTGGCTTCTTSGRTGTGPETDEMQMDIPWDSEAFDDRNDEYSGGEPSL